MQVLRSLVAAAALAHCVQALSSRQSATKITVTLQQQYQTIDGFGISEAFQRAYNIYNLEEPKRTEVLDLLFNSSANARGAGFTILRNGIGSSVDSRNDWMNTILPKSPGSPSGTPEYVWDGKDSGQLWVAQQAARYGVKTFYGNAWSAPGFMKTNGDDADGGGLCGTPGATCSSGDWRQAYADYFVKYVQLYAQEGINVTHLGFVNEPDFSYASMQVNGTQAADFIKVLYPTLQKNNLSHVQITCCEATGWNVQSQYTQQLKLEGVEDMLGVITSHTYTSKITGPQNTTRKVWQIEYSDLSGSWSTAWYSNGGAGDGFTWANNIYTGLTTGNLSAYLWWVGTQDRQTNNNNNEKLILVDNGSYEVSRRLWAFAQYSRTVRPGAIRVGSSAEGNLRTTAFVNTDGSLAVNVINSGESAATTSISAAGFNGTSVQAWVSDNSHEMDPTTATIAPDGTISGSVPGRGMVSFVVVA